MMDDKVYSISNFLTTVKEIVSDIPLFQNVSLVGEISNFNAHHSGHFYFSLKDDNARINVVMFRSSAAQIKFTPKNGDRVVVRGRFDVYVQTGQVQVYALAMNLDGLGDLYIQFERTKKELEARGYFDSMHKKKFPEFPHKIAVICGDNSAAYFDITRTLKERWPIVKQIDLLAYVQGSLATESLVTRIFEANDIGCDLIILARGGGSIEDLWAFNTLPVIEAIYQSTVPIVTGIGHESDTTLADFVSDYRAATPTAAAVFATPDRHKVKDQLTNFDITNYKHIENQIRSGKHDLSRIQSHRIFTNPTSILDVSWQKLDHFNILLTAYSKKLWDLKNDILRFKLQNASHLHSMIKNERTMCRDLIRSTYAKSHLLISEKTRALKSQNDAVNLSMKQSVILKKTAFSGILNSLNHLSPLNVMLRGYSVVSSENKIIKSVDDVSVNDKVSIRMTDGVVHATITRKGPNYE